MADITSITLPNGSSYNFKDQTARQELSNKINTSLKGASNGVAELDSTGKVPSSQLPSYVDDVLEYNSLSNFPTTGETGKIYVAKDTNKTYRWSGTAYVEISPTLALGETSSTAYRGDRGKTAYDHSQSTHARTDATAVTSSSTNGNIKINGTETTVYTHPGSGTNPHGTTKSDVGLGNVGNFKAVSTIASQGLTDTEKSNARANIGAGTSSLALGTSSSTAYRGDYGNSAYAHGVTNKGSAFSSGLYKITTNSEGHVTAATAVEKADITGLGIPGSDTNTHRMIQVNGTEILGNNTTALNLKAGSNVTITNSSGTVTIAATDTTYSSKSAASGGTDVSLVTTGEKYTWNNKGSYSKPSGGIPDSDIASAATWNAKASTTVATTSANGLMSSTDKTKLNGIASGAEVNQNAFSNVVVGSTTIAADGKTDTLTLVAGSNITLTPDATNDKVTIAATDTTYSDVTTSTHGLMTASDKTKLNGIATGAEVNQNAFSYIAVGSETIAADGKTDTLTLSPGSNIAFSVDTTNDKITISAADTTYSDATSSTHGLMSSTDKKLFDEIVSKEDTTYGPSDIVSFNSNISKPVKNLKVNIEPIQSGTGDPSPTNIRPISGWTGVNVTRTGKNLFSSSIEQGTLDGTSGTTGTAANRVRTKDFIQLQEGTYTLSFAGIEKCCVFVYDIQGTYISRIVAAWLDTPYTFTLTEKRNIKIIFSKTNSGNVTPSDINSIRLDLGQTASTYEPFGQIYSITFPSGTTVYDGTLELPSGVLTVDRGEYTIVEDTKLYEFASSSQYGSTAYISMSTAYCNRDEATVMSEIAKSVSYNNRAVDVEDYRVYSYLSASQRPQIYLRASKLDNITTVEQLKAKFINTKIVYKLATPQIYQLDPVTVATLLGQNNVWADCGQTTLIDGSVLSSIQAQLSAFSNYFSSLQS